MIEIFLYIFAGVLVGIGASFIPGLFYSEISLLFFGIITDISAAVFISASAIAFSIFEFISTNIFGIGDDITSLSIGDKFESENLKRIAKTVSMGAIIGLILTIPLVFIFQKIFSQVNPIIKPSVLLIISAAILYTIISEKTLLRKIFAAFIFTMTGIFGMILNNSGFLPSSLILMPVFIGLYGFSSIIARKHHENSIVATLSLQEKIKISLISFGTTLLGIFVPSLKRSQVSAIAFGLGKFEMSETVILALSVISTSFLILSIVALSANSIRSILAYDISEIVEINFNQILIIMGSITLAAAISIFLLLSSVDYLQKTVSKIDNEYLKIFGFVCGSILIVYFTSWQGILLAIIATGIGILSIKMKVRSVHLMGVLLVPTLLRLLNF